jgi:hypothetical protein
MKWLASIWLPFFLASSWVATASAADAPLRTINLTEIGYQHTACGFRLRGEDSYNKPQIEFLSNKYLLFHFATPDSCDPAGYTRDKPGFHTAVMDLFGHVIHTYDWQNGEDVIAGPDGNALVVSRTGVRVVDLNFQTVQTISWQPKGAFYVVVTPSRNGFAIVDLDRAALFIGTPYKEMARTTSSVAAVGDHGFVTLTGGDSDASVVHVDGIEWVTPKHPRVRIFAAPGDGQLLALDNRLNLYRINQRGEETRVARLGWLTPGMWNGIRSNLALPDANRVLFFSHGARIAFTDRSGIWRYFRTAVLDLKIGGAVFQWNDKIGDDVSLSPDGHLVAVREDGRLSLYNIP